MSLALGTSFARLNAGSASVKRMFRGSAGVWNADAADWIKRVEANSGSVSTATANAVTTFCNAIDAAGIRDKFYRLNLFCGTGLNACLVPLYRGPSLSGTQYGNTTDTNNGPFVGDDYAETGASGGLLGNGTSKYLNTGFNVSSLPAADDCHLSSYIRGTQDIASVRALIGTLFDGFSERYRIFLSGLTVGSYYITTELGLANQAGIGSRPNANGGLILASRTSTTSLTLYDDAVYIAANPASTSATTADVPFFVFARNGPTEFYNGLMAGYSIGAGMSSDDVTAYYTAMNTFQTALSREQA